MDVFWYVKPPKSTKHIVIINNVQVHHNNYYIVYYILLCIIQAIIAVLRSRTGQRIVHVESIEFDVLQVQTSVDENSGMKTVNCLH